MEYAASDAELGPSVTEIVTPLYVPTSPSVGIPDSLPVADSNVAQRGMFCTLKVSVSPSGSDALGVNEYVSPILTAPAGFPEIVGTPLEPGGTGIIAPSADSLVKQPLRVTIPAKSR